MRRGADQPIDPMSAGQPVEPMAPDQPVHAGSPDQPIFYYDLGSPYSYLAAERLQTVLPVMPVWQPILLGGIWKETGGRSWATTDQRDAGIAEIERRAAEYGRMPIRWP